MKNKKNKKTKHNQDSVMLQGSSRDKVKENVTKKKRLKILKGRRNGEAIRNITFPFLHPLEINVTAKN